MQYQLLLFQWGKILPRSTLCSMDNLAINPIIKCRMWHTIVHSSFFHTGAIADSLHSFGHSRICPGFIWCRSSHGAGISELCHLAVNIHSRTIFSRINFAATHFNFFLEPTMTIGMQRTLNYHQYSVLLAWTWAHVTHDTPIKVILSEHACLSSCNGRLVISPKAQQCLICYLYDSYTVLHYYARKDHFWCLWKY